MYLGLYHLDYVSVHEGGMIDAVQTVNTMPMFVYIQPS